MKRMKQKDWLTSPRHCCPVCRSTDIESTGDWSAFHYEIFCHLCGQTFQEVMKVVGYRLLKKEQRSFEASELREQFDAVKDYEADRKERYCENPVEPIILGGSRIQFVDTDTHEVVRTEITEAI